MGLLTKLRIIPAHTHYIFGTKNDDKREFDTVSNAQDNFMMALGRTKRLENTDFYNYQGELALFIEGMHLGTKPVPDVISRRENIFIAVPELGFCKNWGDPKFYLASMIDIDCHKFEDKVNWGEIAVNIAKFCSGKGLRYLWNKSRSGGLHIWFFFTEPTPEDKTRNFIVHLGKAFKNGLVYDFPGRTNEVAIKQSYETRPAFKGVQRVALPCGTYYKNYLYDMEDFEGESPVDVDKYDPPITPDNISDWQSTTKRRKVDTEKEEEKSEIADRGFEFVRNYINRRYNAVSPQADWAKSNTRPDTFTGSLQSQVAADPYFSEFNEEIVEVMPCILARIVLGPKQTHNWGLTIFNVSLSCLAIFGTEEQDEIEKALNLTTLIMNHPNIDWEDRPRDKEYYRTTGSFSGAVKWMQSGKSPSCHSAQVESMMEHCRPAECSQCRGGYQNISMKGSEDVINRPLHFFEIQIINDPFESARHKERYYASEFVVDPSIPIEDMLIEITDSEIMDPFKFQSALKGRVPHGYDFIDFLDAMKPAFKNKKVWQVVWHDVLLNPKKTTIDMILHEAKFLRRLELQLARYELSRKGAKGVTEIMFERWGKEIFIHIHDSIIETVCRIVSGELKSSPNIYNCKSMYMRKIFDAITINGYWRIDWVILDRKNVMPSRLRYNIEREIFRTVPPDGTSPGAPHKEKNTESKSNIVTLLDKFHKGD